ncbi:hypothetical protein N24_1568 [Corynebacterium suranareeae]|uniref:Lipid/polyisoprenoid-binding YceI-like domain-containing protein n=2 Tax=Corynebacterium suranareeae TaxID=2506452 RepID=A0A160PTK0_9CORY|nr:hypothetical protein N24_1568 [Corynebacterium suranareeae]
MQGNGPKKPVGDSSRADSPLIKYRTLIIVVFVILIVGLASVAVGPVVYQLIMGPGVKTEGIKADGAAPASTDLNGTWDVVPGSLPNTTSAGFTFAEILPGEEKITSGSTTGVDGEVVIEDNTLLSGLITVNMTHITTDQEKRDINVRTKLFHTDQYPEATFEVTDSVDLSELPDTGTIAQVVIPGELTIHGETKAVEPTFNVLRTGDQVVVASDIEINRLDFGVETPEFIAAKINETGEINVRIVLEK